LGRWIAELAILAISVPTKPTFFDARTWCVLSLVTQQRLLTAVEKCGARRRKIAALGVKKY